MKKSVNTAVFFFTTERLELDETRDEVVKLDSTVLVRVAQDERAERGVTDPVT